MARLSAAQLQTLWLQAGGSNGSIRIGTGQTLSLPVVMAAIALAESREGDPAAINPGYGAGGRRTNEYSVGLWQINTLVHKNYSVDQLKDPLINAREAVRIFRLEGLRAWGAYTDGRYRQYLSTSIAAGGNGISALPSIGPMSLNMSDLPMVLAMAILVYLLSPRE